MKIAHSTPAKILTNDELIEQCGDGKWTAERLERATGIKARHVAQAESVADLACAAASRLFADTGTIVGEIDFLLLGTLRGDITSPSTACIVQDRLGIPQSAGALDFNLGCSGFVYGLSLAKGLLAIGAAKKILLINSDTLTRAISSDDFAFRSVIGDAATAVYLDAEDLPHIGEFVFGTDGSGVHDLNITDGIAHMDGTAVYTFMLRVVPDMVDAVLSKNSVTKEDVDLFVFHQPNKLLLSALPQFLEIDRDKIAFDIEDTGNTSGCTIPISLEKRGDLAGKTVLIAGFGIGLSWAATVLRY